MGVIRWPCNFYIPHIFTTRTRQFSITELHMMVGITILVVLLVRLVMCLTVKRPADATAGYKLLDIIAKIVHYGLYLTVLTVTVLVVTFTSQSGMLQSAFTGSRPEFNGPPPGFNNSQPGFTPPTPGEFQGRPDGGPSGGFRSPARLLHRLVAYLVAVLLGIHIPAALYHQFIRRDNLFARMWYGSRYLWMQAHHHIPVRAQDKKRLWMNLHAWNRMQLETLEDASNYESSLHQAKVIADTLTRAAAKWNVSIFVAVL